ncbi:hypothetical protein GBF35_33040 [Nonomuraea phyllanthi]|uniref:hypothetical protein n=1 Tax=Nonomuraea phyllanthi TaxID=2219224 RepID=UPI00129394B0|nr:hypothetical protein [Nonomuraea phyllanthi]QFY10793.1 hypothetical protein GBF35_33040 [Nonomuraea phyllanthi]
MDLDEVAGRLYALPPSEFTAARQAEARSAKDAGDVRLAREIAKLRKPTVSAWAVNRIAREHPDELDELLDVGERLRAAWQEQDADALAELVRLRGEVTGKVGRLARQEGDLSPAAAAEVDRTLESAIVDAAAAGQVRAGCLVKPLDYSGFAPAPATRERPAGREPRTDEAGDREEAGRAGKGRKAAGAGEAAEAGKGAGAGRGAEAGGGAKARARTVKEREEAEARRAEEPEEAKARRAKEREEAKAREAEERAEAEAAHKEWQEALRAAQEEYDERADRVTRLQRKLTKARKRLADSEQRLKVAQREERNARRRLR